MLSWPPNLKCRCSPRLSGQNVLGTRLVFHSLYDVPTLAVDRCRLDSVFRITVASVCRICLGVCLAVRVLL